MSESRRQILQMLSDGKITADDAERLLNAAERPTGVEAPPRPVQTAYAPDVARPRPKYLRVQVDADEGHGRPTKINVRVPMQLIRAGVKLTSLIPPQARDKVNAAMRRQGMDFDLNTMKPSDLEELVDNLGDLTVDVDATDARVRVFAE